MATTRRDQREALGRVRSDDKQLLATIDNLIDVSRIEGRTLQRQSVDLATIARHAAESAVSEARERQVVTVEMTGDAEARETTAVSVS